MDFSSGKYRLLLEDNAWFFVFEPQGEGSIIVVFAIPKNKVSRYEVIIK